VQTRDAILKGAHPISMEYAVQFAGMQCQIQFSDHVETKHKPGFIEYELQSLIITNNNNNNNNNNNAVLNRRVSFCVYFMC